MYGEQLVLSTTREKLEWLDILSKPGVFRKPKHLLNSTYTLF